MRTEYTIFRLIDGERPADNELVEVEEGKIGSLIIPGSPSSWNQQFILGREGNLARGLISFGRRMGPPVSGRNGASLSI
jgi:hypothetical protein